MVSSVVLTRLDIDGVVVFSVHELVLVLCWSLNSNLGAVDAAQNTWHAILVVLPGRLGLVLRWGVSPKRESD